MVSDAAIKAGPRTLRLLPEDHAPEAPTFIGSSPAVLGLLDRADRLAKTDLPLLVTGETGTGKEVLARRIHGQSRRCTGPFVAENCAAWPHALIESELFGHAAGSFTGADRDRGGVFARADGGTLLLDEIGDMPLAAQAKLLRVLEDGRVRPVGADRSFAVDVRVIYATHRDLEVLVQAGEFREDLYYRIRGATLTIPPLRERPEDVRELARYFLDGVNEEHGTNKRLSERVLARLEAHRWPGNVRELRSQLQLLFTFSDGDVIDGDEHCPFLEDGEVGRTEGPTEVKPLAELERDAICRALRATGGNRREAARLLAISRSSIFAKIRRYKCDGDPEFTAWSVS